MEKNYEDRVSDLLLSVLGKIMLTENRALITGYFHDVSVSEMHVIDTIGAYDSKTTGETANKLGITIGSLTVAIHKLVKKDYVVRQKDEKDKRIVRLSLTKKGKLVCRIYNRSYINFAKHLLKPFSDGKEELLCDMLSHLNSCLQDEFNKYESKNQKRKKQKESL